MISSCAQCLSLRNQVMFRVFLIISKRPGYIWSKLKPIYQSVLHRKITHDSIMCWMLISENWTSSTLTHTDCTGYKVCTYIGQHMQNEIRPQISTFIQPGMTTQIKLFFLYTKHFLNGFKNEKSYFPTMHYVLETLLP